MDRVVTHTGSRAALIALVLTDCDGVLTDGGVYYGPDGEVLKRFSIRDGMGVERLRNAGVEVGIISGERSGSIAARAAKLGITELHLGVRDKRARLEEICRGRSLRPEQIAYIGDDVNDVEAMGMVGLAGAPADALPEARQAAHVVVDLPGGHGAFRAFAELIITSRTAEEATA